MVERRQEHAAHDHEHGHNHRHEEEKGVWGWITAVLHLHGHDDDHHNLAADRAFMDNEAGIRTVWWALAALGITSLLQLVIVYLSGSVALLADTAHNIGDGLNSVPLLIAFYLARRVATRRYTYGYGRSEDIAGIFIVLSIAVSAGIVFWESFQRLLDPQPLQNLGWVAAAAIVGFLGNEAVAILQIRVGRRIGSAAMVADGLHARTDGLTSLAVLVAVFGSFIGVPILDPIVGILIGVAILFITWDATKSMWFRLMDAIEPEIVTAAEAVLYQMNDIQSVEQLRLRWLGHRLQADAIVKVAASLTAVQIHALNQEIQHQLEHALPQLGDIVIQTQPNES